MFVGVVLKHFYVNLWMRIIDYNLTFISANFEL